MQYLLGTVGAPSNDLLAQGVSIGARTDSAASISAFISRLEVSDTALSCTASGVPQPSSADQRRKLQQAELPTDALAVPGVLSLPSALTLPAPLNVAPVITDLRHDPAGDVFIGDQVSFSGSVSDADGDALRVVMTLFGVAPANCGNSAGCGDIEVTSNGVDGQASVQVRMP